MHPTVLVEAAEIWPAVVGGLVSGLGAAGIVAYVTLRAARKQRQNDTALAKQQRNADAERTEKQLAHDRDVRNLQFLRETLAPIAERVIDWTAFTSLHFELAQSEGPAFEQRLPVVQQLVNQVSDTTEQLSRDGRVLVILLGADAELSKWVRELASDGQALIHIVRKRREANEMTPEIRAALDGLWTKYGFDQARFVEHANKTVRLDSD
jgi:FAD/FMN-containing dehydrogenase